MKSPNLRFSLPKKTSAGLHETLGIIPDRYIVVDTALQRLFDVDSTFPQRAYPVSTSRYGTGNREGSYRTPLGIHRIAEMIGHNAPSGRIFTDRCDTHQDWTPGTGAENLILSRIMWLEGLEPGINRGPGIDTRERYIYIHGTNREEEIGTPISHGCVLMRNIDVIDLFDRLEKGTIVVIN